MAGLYVPNGYGESTFREVNSNEEYQQASKDVARAIRDCKEVPPQTMQAVLQWNGYYDKSQLLRTY